jgi:hypothetical protein
VFALLIIDAFFATVICSNAKLLSAEGFLNLTESQWWSSSAGHLLFATIVAYAVLIAGSFYWKRHHQLPDDEVWHEWYFFTHNESLAEDTWKSYLVKIWGVICRIASSKQRKSMLLVNLRESSILAVAAHEVHLNSTDLRFIKFRAQLLDVTAESADTVLTFNKWDEKVSLALQEGRDILEKEDAKFDDVLYKKWLLLKETHPLTDVFRHSLFRPMSFRVMLFICKGVGALAVSALFFSSGVANVNDPLSCQVQNAWWYNIFMGIFASAVNLIPLLIVDILHYRTVVYIDLDNPAAEARTLRSWFWQDAFVYAFLFFHITQCYLLLFIFLANVPETARTDWYVSALTIILKQLVLWPFLGALFTVYLDGVSKDELIIDAETDKLRTDLEALCMRATWAVGRKFGEYAANNAEVLDASHLAMERAEREKDEKEYAEAVAAELKRIEERGKCRAQLFSARFLEPYEPYKSHNVKLSKHESEASHRSVLETNNELTHAIAPRREGDIDVSLANNEESFYGKVVGAGDHRNFAGGATTGNSKTVGQPPSPKPVGPPSKPMQSPMTAPNQWDRPPSHVGLSVFTSGRAFEATTDLDADVSMPVRGSFDTSAATTEDPTQLASTKSSDMSGFGAMPARNSLQASEAEATTDLDFEVSALAACSGMPAQAPCGATTYDPAQLTSAEASETIITVMPGQRAYPTRPLPLASPDPKGLSIHFVSVRCRGEEMQLPSGASLKFSLAVPKLDLFIRIDCPRGVRPFHAFNPQLLSADGLEVETPLFEVRSLREGWLRLRFPAWCVSGFGLKGTISVAVGGAWTNLPTVVATLPFELQCRFEVQEPQKPQKPQDAWNALRRLSENMSTRV